MQKRRTYTLPRVWTTFSALEDSSSSPASSIARSLSGVRALSESVVKKSLRLVLSKPFTSLHATTQRWQPTQRVVSIRIALLISQHLGRRRARTRSPPHSRPSAAFPSTRHAEKFSMRGLKCDFASEIFTFHLPRASAVVKSPNSTVLRPKKEGWARSRRRFAGSDCLYFLSVSDSNGVSWRSFQVAYLGTQLRYSDRTSNLPHGSKEPNRFFIRRMKLDYLRAENSTPSSASRFRSSQ